MSSSNWLWVVTGGCQQSLTCNWWQRTATKISLWLLWLLAGQYFALNTPEHAIKHSQTAHQTVVTIHANYGWLQQSTSHQSICKDCFLHKTVFSTSFTTQLASFTNFIWQQPFVSCQGLRFFLWDNASSREVGADTHLKNEFAIYEKMPDLSAEEDPLTWWSLNEKTLPH